MKPQRPLAVRVKLTLWYVAAMLAVLAVYAAGVFAVVSRSSSLALDERVRSDFRWASEMWEQKPDGSLTWFEHDPGSEDSPWLQVWTPGGELLYRTMLAEWYPIDESASLATRADGRIAEAAGGTGTFRVLSGRSRLGARSVVIQVARSEAGMRQELRELLLFLVLGLPLAVAVAGLGGYTLARRALAPVERMADRARSITAEHLSDRLPVDNPRDEFGRLATVFNETLARLEASFGQMRRFTSDVSHELRTPLTAMRSVGEVGLRERRDERTYREIIGSMLEEVDRLSILVERLLMLSRVESGQARLTVEPVDLRELADEVSGQLGVLAEEKGQAIDLEGPGGLWCLADRVVLRQAVMNLVDNAIKYSPQGGHIRIRVSDTAEGAALDISDDGPGIAPARAAHIFDRFYRASPPGTAEGAGLGLSIAKWAVEVNGGQLTLEESRRGCTFRITLPSAAAPSRSRAGPGEATGAGGTGEARTRGEAGRVA
jgi:heavy metal sensor kinase